MKSTYLLLLTAAALSAAPVDRPADREEIRAHIDSIFQAFIHKDSAALRATHDENWRGFLEGSRQIIRGIGQYMNATASGVASPYGMTSYKMRDFDIAFEGDAAFVSFIADVEARTPSGPVSYALRIADFYAKRNGHWIQAGSDTTVHPDSEAQRLQTRQLSGEAKESLLKAREAVWRAFFGNDRASLEKLVPADAVTIDSGSSRFGNQQSVLAGAAAFATSGQKLVRIEFPKTEIQCYGYTAILYTTYEYELEGNGKRSTRQGRATEVFVLRDGQWVNPGWHIDNVQ